MVQFKQPVSVSTSRHELSADGELSKVQRILWIAYNLWNNSFPGSRVDPELDQRKFSLTETQLNEMWERIAPVASPARRLCDLFWMACPWPKLMHELGTVRAVELGCGSGVYGRLLATLLGGSLGRYTGVDIQADKHWVDYAGDPRFNFSVARAREAFRFLPDANLILTQSALEHFEEDLLYFDQVAEHVRNSKYPILQIHLIPSAGCITTFPWHGVREYTPRTLSKITRLFGTETQRYLFDLGGSMCNRVHRKFITWPNLRGAADLRHARNAQYLLELRSAILHDFSGSSGSPAFYALLLASNFKEWHFPASSH